jgi:hypothetical protein
MKDVAKSFFLDYWTYIVITVLVLVLFRNCKDNENLQLANSNYKQEIKISQLQVDKYANRINVLNDRITMLETTKQGEKVKIVTVLKEVAEKISVTENLTTKGIANFYSDRYKMKPTITQYGVALKDTIHKMVIVDLIKKDGLVLELNHTKIILNIAEKQLNIKDDVIVLKDSIIKEKNTQIDTHIQLEKNLNKSVKSERTKKTIWQIATGAFLVGAGYLLIK